MQTKTIDPRTLSKQNLLSLKKLKSLVHYNPDTGVFTYVTSRAKWIKPGDVAGFFNKNGYQYLSLAGVKFLGHRVAWFYTHGVWPDECIDHINGNPSDNRLCNLRLATRSQNSQSKKISVRLGSGFRGVNKCPRTGKWRARVQFQIGLFPTKEAAARAVDVVMKQHFGEYARLNFPNRS